MKKWISLLLAGLCALLPFTALGEADFSMLEAMENASVYLDDDGVTSVVRPGNQPFLAATETEGVTVCAFLDAVEDANLGLTLLRFSLTVEAEDNTWGRELRLKVGKKTYVFPVVPRISEYDMVYQEDYSVCLTGVSLPMVKQMAADRRGVYEFELVGEYPVRGTLTMPAQSVKPLYDLYAASGALKQDFAQAEVLYPCGVE